MSDALFYLQNQTGKEGQSLADFTRAGFAALVGGHAPKPVATETTFESNLFAKSLIELNTQRK